MKHLTGTEYRKAFGIDPVCRTKRRRALFQALDARKFEIELYWKRATYFWTFIGAALAAFGAIQISSQAADRRHLTVLVGSLGLVFSLGWHCVNRGSKRWHENWENHVELLEDEFIGPLHKTILGRAPVAKREGLGRWIWDVSSQILTGPSQFSVTKINQLVSLFVTILWVPMLWKALSPINPTLLFDWFLVFVIGLTLLICAFILAFGRSDAVNYSFLVEQRMAEVWDVNRPPTVPAQPLDNSMPTTTAEAVAADDA